MACALPSVTDSRSPLSQPDQYVKWSFGHLEASSFPVFPWDLNIHLCLHVAVPSYEPPIRLSPETASKCLSTPPYPLF